jgi:L-fuculose-phosphate aldolase
MPNPWKLKQEMCEIGRRIYERGLVSAFEGNLSVRIAPDRLLCTPSFMCKGFLKPEHLCVVDLNGKQISGERKRSSEIFLHLSIYRERPEAEAVVHTHAPHASAFAITHTPVPNCITGEMEVFLGEVPLAPYATPGSEQMGAVVAQLLRDARSTSVSSVSAGTSDKGIANSSDVKQRFSAEPSPHGRQRASAGADHSRPPFAILLANHGVVSWGKSLEEALHRTEILESYCRTVILARPLGPLKRLSDASMRELMALKLKLGIPDCRAVQESFEECDLCGNSEFGRGFCEPSTALATDDRAKNAPSQPPSSQRPQADIEAIVSEITDRVWSVLYTRD